MKQKRESKLLKTMDTGQVKAQRIRLLRQAFKLKKLVKSKKHKKSIEDEEQEFLKALALLEAAKLEEEE